MQAHTDSGDGEARGDFRFSAIKQLRCNSHRAKCRNHVEVLDLRNIQFREGRILGRPVHRHISGEEVAGSRHKTSSMSRSMLREVSLILRNGFTPADLREGRGVYWWVFFVQRTN